MHISLHDKSVFKSYQAIYTVIIYKDIDKFKLLRHYISKLFLIHASKLIRILNICENNIQVMLSKVVS